jgi:hypothetical protein
MKILRWVLVVPMWLAGLVVWIVSTILLESVPLWFCPPKLTFPPACAADWGSAADHLSVCVGAAIGAMAVVSLPVLVAPEAKARVALVAYCCGALFAGLLWFLMGPGVADRAPFLSALVAGFVVGAALVRRHNAA